MVMRARISATLWRRNGSISDAVQNRADSLVNRLSQARDKKSVPDLRRGSDDRLRDEWGAPVVARDARIPLSTGGTPMPTLIDKADTNGRQDSWSVSKAIAPFGRNDKDDVKLVQTMLLIFLTSPDLPEDEQGEFSRIMDATVSSGGKFADGIYGANTRAAVGILERTIGSPVKDGIIRPVFETDRLGRTSGSRGTKMGELNEFWDANAITADAASKKESGRKFLEASVFEDLYGEIFIP